MSDKLNQMDKLNFLLGTWNLNYKVPTSKFSIEDSGAGEGSFKRILNNNYITFDYYAKLSKSEGAAHAIFAWDEKNNTYRYWWFEDSGGFMEATCNFTDDDTLCLNWCNSELVQTFQRMEDEKKIILQMKSPLNENEYEIIMEVLFTKKQLV